MLALAGASAAFGSLLDGQLDGLLGRLARASTGTLGKLLPTARELVAVPRRARVKYRAGHAEILAEFLRGASIGRAVRASYRSPNGERPRTGRYALAKVVPNDGALYLLLDDVDRPERRPAMYALHRFLKAVVLTKVAAQADRTRAAKVVSPTLEPWVSDSPIQASIRVAPEWSRFFAEREWVAGQKLTTDADGGLTFCGRFASRELLFQFVLSQAPHLALLAPDDLRSDLAEQLEWLSRRHKAKTRRSKG